MFHVCWYKIGYIKQTNGGNHKGLRNDYMNDELDVWLVNNNVVSLLFSLK